MICIGLQRVPESEAVAVWECACGHLHNLRAPLRLFLGERSGPDVPWSTISYGEALRQVRAAGAWMLAQGMSAQRPLVILSDNSIEHALLSLAAMHVGIPAAAISPAYSLVSKD